MIILNDSTGNMSQWRVKLTLMTTSERLRKKLTSKLYLVLAFTHHVRVRVKRYQSMLKGGIPSRFDTSGALNSCGNSDASSDDNLSGDEYVVSGRDSTLVHVIFILGTYTHLSV